jgi:hypothetical protein
LKFSNLTSRSAQNRLATIRHPIKFVQIGLIASKFDHKICMKDTKFISAGVNIDRWRFKKIIIVLGYPVILRSYIEKMDSLRQPWPTQIGSRATFLKNHHCEGRNLDFFYTSNRFCSKMVYFRDWRRATLKSFKGRMRPAGRGLAMAGLRSRKIIEKYSICGRRFEFFCPSSLYVSS